MLTVSLILKNGLRLVVVENPRAPVVAQMMWYDFGSSIEERGTYHRIRLGPFNDNKEIYALCIDLKLVNNECLIVKGN